MNPSSQAEVLRLAVQNLANAPQAQRRYIQMGLMEKSIEDIQELGADPRGLEGSERFSEQGVALIVAVREELIRQLEANDDLLELGRSGPREFLYSDALEGEGWDELRSVARRCNDEISGDVSALLAK